MLPVPGSRKAGSRLSSSGSVGALALVARGAAAVSGGAIAARGAAPTAGAPGMALVAPSRATMKLVLHLGQRIFMPFSGMRRSSTSYGDLHETHSTLIMFLRPVLKGTKPCARVAVSAAGACCGKHENNTLARA